MQVDKHTIKLWSTLEVEDLLRSNNVPYVIKQGFSQTEEPSAVPIFILEGLKN